ncbi:hypothetical protein MMC12_000924 [Toensbergia leucococca]|nr:hypothetical protein [Toensbergia leucococca]
MDIFHLKEKRQSSSGGGGRSPSAGRSSSRNSPQLAPALPAILEIDMESPPLVFYGSPAHSTGALLSGQLNLTVIDPEVKLGTFHMVLLSKTETKKPVGKDCRECSTKSTELFTWKFLTEPAKFKKGLHHFPFSYLLPGRLPASTNGSLGAMVYELSAKAVTTLADTLAVKRPLVVRRALMPGMDKTSIRIFPPTNLTATIVLPSAVHPIGQFPVQMRLSGIVDRSKKDFDSRWRLRKLIWRIDEHSKIISAACPRHAHKIGGDGKGILHQDTRSIGDAHLKEGWKTDWEAGGGQIDFEFQAVLNPLSSPICDVDSPTGLTVNHNFVVELVVAEEYAPGKKIKTATPTGTARVLRMQFTLTVTDRYGLGISWDEEQPPMYEDVPGGSPPGYARMDDYDGEPLAYEDLDGLV